MNPMTMMSQSEYHESVAAGEAVRAETVIERALAELDGELDQLMMSIAMLGKRIQLGTAPDQSVEKNPSPGPDACGGSALALRLSSQVDLVARCRRAIEDLSSRVEL